MKIPPKIMNREIQLYDVYILNTRGQLKLANSIIKSTNDYSHLHCDLHHYIQYELYERNKQWFIDRGIKQKLILLKKYTHALVENRNSGKSMSDEDFYKKYKISRWDLLFRYKHYEEIE